MISSVRSALTVMTVFPAMPSMSYVSMLISVFCWTMALPIWRTMPSPRMRPPWKNVVPASRSSELGSPGVRFQNRARGQLQRVFDDANAIGADDAIEADAKRRR